MHWPVVASRCWRRFAQFALRSAFGIASRSYGLLVVAGAARAAGPRPMICGAEATLRMTNPGAGRKPRNCVEVMAGHKGQRTAFAIDFEAVRSRDYLYRVDSPVRQSIDRVEHLKGPTRSSSSTEARRR